MTGPRKAGTFGIGRCRPADVTGAEEKELFEARGDVIFVVKGLSASAGRFLANKDPSVVNDRQIEPEVRHV